MASQLNGDASSLAAPDGTLKGSQEKPEEVGGNWYFSRKELEENSPSRQDGIDMKKETYLRKSYCTFLQDLGMRLKVPQVTIATAIIFCHRFFHRQSHTKNDRRTIATVCMFLAGKVEETPRPLKDVILVSYEINHKKDPAAVQKIKQKEVYVQQKELVLLGERVVLGTLSYDLNVHHPYKPLVEAIKKFKVAQNSLAQVAWNFVNDGLRTSLCLQFKPHHIAAGAIFLAAKFLKVKLPADGEKFPWWQEFDVTPRQLEGWSPTYLPLLALHVQIDQSHDAKYYQHQAVSNQMLELYEQNKPTQANEADGSAGDCQRPPSKAIANEEHSTLHTHGGATSLKPTPSRPSSEGHQTRNSEYGSSENNSQVEDEIHEREVVSLHGNSEAKVGNGDDTDHDRDAGESKDKIHGRNLPNKDDSTNQTPQESTKKPDMEKLKAVLERRKARGDITRKIDPLDELERELEDVEVPSDNDKSKHERKQSIKSSHEDDIDTVEEGEVKLSDEADQEYRSPNKSTRKRKAGSPLERNGLGRHNYSERDHKRQVQENHV